MKANPSTNTNCTTDINPSMCTNNTSSMCTNNTRLTTWIDYSIQNQLSWWTKEIPRLRLMAIVNLFSINWRNFAVHVKKIVSYITLNLWKKSISNHIQMILFHEKLCIFFSLHADGREITNMRIYLYFQDKTMVSNWISCIYN